MQGAESGRPRVRAAVLWSGRGGQGYRGAGRDPRFTRPSRTTESALALADLTHEGQEVVMAQGARRQRQCRFKSSTVQVPRFAQPGEDGEKNISAWN